MLQDIFNFSNSGEVITPPDQVFKNRDYIYMLVSGVNIAYDERQYAELINFFKIIGEKNIYYCENSLNNTIEFSLPVESTFYDLQNKFKILELDFGLTPFEFFMFGDLVNWGMYLSECPTVLIIGCVPELADGFRTVYDIDGNGYAALKDFISQEYYRHPEMIPTLEKNYKLI